MPKRDPVCEFWFVVGQMVGLLSHDDLRIYLQSYGFDVDTLDSQLKTLATIAYKDR